MAKARLAGQIFNAAKGAAGKASKFLGIDEMDAITKLYRFGPDAGFAVMNAVQTPGDLTDKLIAGTTDFVGSAGTGLALSAPFKKSPGVANVIDMTGSVAGMYGGMAVSDRLQRAKDSLTGGEGLSAYERANAIYEDQLKAQLIQDLNAAGMLNPQAAALLTNDNTGVV